MKQNRVHPGSWLVYFNGIEVPARSVNVSAGRWQIPEARISFAPDRILRRIGSEDRVRATVFYLDSYRPSPTGEDDQYRLLFDGEITNWGFQSSPKRKFLTFHAIDFMQVLTNVFPFMISDVSSLAQAMFNVAPGNQIGAGATTSGTAMTYFMTKGFQGIKKEGETGNGITEETRIERPFGFIESMLDLLFGDALVGSEDQRSAMTKGFLQFWNNRQAFVNRWAPSALIENPALYDKGSGFPIVDAVQSETAVNSTLTAARNRMNQFSGKSMWRVLKETFGHMSYDISFVTAPPIHRVDADTKNIIEPAGELVEDDDGSYTLMSYATKPNLSFTVPPACNVMWPSTVNNLNYNENFATQPTRTYVGDPHKLNRLGGSRREGVPGEDLAYTYAYPENIDDRIADHRENRGKEGPGGFQNIQGVFNGLQYPNEYTKGPVLNRNTIPAWYSYLEQSGASEEVMKRFTELEHYRKRYSKRRGSVSGTFNPYPVMGFPGVVMDEEDSNTHLYADFVSISHELTSESMSTSINFVNGRTFEEVFRGITLQQHQQEEASSEFERFDSFPIHPVKQVRETFQRNEAAFSYYREMFFSNDENADQEQESVIFRPEELLAVDVDGERQELDFSANSADNNTVTQETNSFFPKYTTKKEYDKYRKDPNAALKYNSRPVCTLEQFSDFHPERGRKEQLIPTSAKKQGKSAPYWVKILHYEAGPQPPFSQESDGSICIPFAVDEVADLGETRRDWEAFFRAFRQRFYSDKPYTS